MKNQIINKTGWIIVILNVLAILNATWYFLGMAKFPFQGWIFFNACTPSIVLFLIGFLLKNSYVMSASLPFLLYFGGGGLFVFSWTGTSVIAQVSHILMVLSASYVVAFILVNKFGKKWLIGFASGLLLFLLFFAVIAFKANRSGIR